MKKIKLGIVGHGFVGKAVDEDLKEMWKNLSWILFTRQALMT